MDDPRLIKLAKFIIENHLPEPITRNRCKGEACAICSKDNFDAYIANGDVHTFTISKIDHEWDCEYYLAEQILEDYNG